MNIEEIRMQLDHLASLPSALDKIHSQGFYNLFFTSFQSLHSQSKSFKTQEFKKCLKIIMTEMIDNIWESHIGDNVEISPQTSDRRKNSITPTKVLKKSVNSCANLKINYRAPGASTFAKQKRSIQKDIPVTPGPGDYEVAQASNRSRSPSTVFNKEKRAFDLAHKESPGPSAYSPISHTKSKHCIVQKENL